MKRGFFSKSANFSLICLVSLLIAFSVSVFPASAQIRECVGPKGDAIFTDQQCPPGYSLKGTTEERAPASTAKDAPHDMSGRDEDTFRQVLLLTAEKLEKCEPYSIIFSHVFTGEELERRIVGIVDGKCVYVEEMPEGGKMECRYSVESRKAVAQYYRDFGNSESASSRVSFSDEGVESTDTIDGKEVKNPMQGECQIIGY